MALFPVKKTLSSDALLATIRSEANALINRADAALDVAAQEQLDNEAAIAALTDEVRRRYEEIQASADRAKQLNDLRTVLELQLGTVS